MVLGGAGAGGRLQYWISSAFIWLCSWKKNTLLLFFSIILDSLFIKKYSDVYMNYIKSWCSCSRSDFSLNIMSNLEWLHVQVYLCVVWALSSLCDTWYCSLSACVCYWPFCRQHHSFIASICQLQLLKIWLWTPISHLLCLFLSLSRSSTLPFNSSFISNFCLLSPSFFLTCFPGHFLLLFFPPPSCRKSR